MRKKEPRDTLLVERIVSARFSDRLGRVYLHGRFTMHVATDAPACGYMHTHTHTHYVRIVVRRINAQVADEGRRWCMD